MTAPAPPATYTVAAIIGGCVADALADTSAGAPERVCVPVAGAVAWDGCDCGQLAVTTQRIYPSNRFPAEAGDDGNQGACGAAYLVVEMLVSLTRCAARPDDAGNPPPCDDLRADALVWHEDVAAIRNALGCCLIDLREDGTIAEFVLRGTTPAGPQGGCVGSETLLYVGLPHCMCRHEGS